MEESLNLVKGEHACLTSLRVNLRVSLYIIGISLRVWLHVIRGQVGHKVKQACIFHVRSVILAELGIYFLNLLDINVSLIILAENKLELLFRLIF